MDLKEIIESWIISSNPTEVQKDIANNRLEVCKKCELFTELNKKYKILTICSGCGCPIHKKVFSTRYNPCPLKKWNETDEVYLKKEKNNKSII